MSGPNTLQNMAILERREFAAQVADLRVKRSRTYATVEKGRKQTGQMNGMEIPYSTEAAHGQTLYNPGLSDYSFRPSLPQNFKMMYVAPVYRNMNMQMEKHLNLDRERGKIPYTKMDERADRLATHYMKTNWACIGNGDAGVAEIASAAVATITFKLVNTARGQSKGSFRLFESTTDHPLLYDAVNPATDAVVATFWISSKPTALTAVVGAFTVGNIAATNVAGLRVCETGQWKKEFTGFGAHITDQNRIYQAVDTTTEKIFNSKFVDAGNAAPTPTMVRSVKAILNTKANDSGEEFDMLCHLTEFNHESLANFGYAFRQYQAANGQADKTYGVPRVYVDEDTMFFPDADYEEGFIDFRKRTPFFIYEQKALGPNGPEQEWQGSFAAGSTLNWENMNESFQLVYDARGKDGSTPRSKGGIGSQGAFIKNVAIDANKNQAVVG